MMEYFYHIIIFILIFSILAQACNLIKFFSGLLAISYAAFFGIGAYISALITINLGFTFLGAMILGMIIAGGISAMLSLPALRIRQIYLLVFTMAFQIVIYQLFMNLGITKGSQGIIGIPRPVIWGLEIRTNFQYLVFYFVIAFIVQAFTWWLMHSPFGRALKSIREDTSAAESIGKDALRLSIMIFVIGGAMCALAGSLYAHYITYINPSSFSVTVSIMVLVFVVLGGPSNFWGAILGTALVIGIPEALRFLPGAAGIVDCIREILYGFLLVVFMFLRPVGLIPEKSASTQKVRAIIERNTKKGNTSDPSDMHFETQGNKIQEPKNPIVVEVKGLSKAFGGLQAVQNASLTLVRGKITAVVGPNGCGKTTLFNLMTGFLTPDSGSIFFGGKDITRDAPHNRVRTGLSRSWQDIRVFPELTVADNVMAAFPKQSGENILSLVFSPFKVIREEKQNLHRAVAYLRSLGIEGKGDKLACDISAAEQKLLGLARLLSTECSVLLLDEPTCGLDPDSVRRIGNMIRQIVQQGRKTVFLIEHNLDVIRDLAEMVYFMNEGQIIASGTPEELMANPKLAEVYFGV